MHPSVNPSLTTPPTTPKPPRKYSGPTKGSKEAKDRMEKVRAAQWAKNGLVVGNSNGR